MRNHLRCARETTVGFDVLTEDGALAAGGRHLHTPSTSASTPAACTR